jgi:hypothetical protein
MSKADTHATTPAPADPAPDDAMEGWEIGDVEPVLHNLKGDIAILGHLINTRDEVAPDTWARLEDTLTDTYATLMERWHGSWRFQIAERKAAMGALEAAKAERDAPGSIGDVKQADASWRLLRVAAEVTLERCEKRDLVSPVQATDAVAAQTAAERKAAPEARMGEQYLNRPDGGLLRMAREFAKIDAQIQVLNELPDPSEAAMDAVSSRQYAITDIMIDTPAKTAAGWRAKAEVLDASIRLDVTSPDSEHRLATSLAADLMREIKPGGLV